MRVVLLLAAVTACSKPAEPRTELPERVSVPGSVARVESKGSAIGALAPDEGTLEMIAPAAASVGTATTARVRLTPGAGFHINTEYPMVLTLKNNAGVTVAKARLVNRDAETLTEKELSIPITVTPTATGDQHLTGKIVFGICKRDSCLQREMPIDVRVASS